MILDKIFDLPRLVGEVLDRIKLSPERKAEIQLEMAKNTHEIAKMEAELEARMVDVAGQNIRSETGHEDKFTARARPSFIYIVNFILLFNYIVAPLAGRPSLELPEPMIWLFGSVMLGYVGARSWEKVYTK